ncbi:Mbeg1-like protein [Breznakia pachnodae]|uniref:DUF2974 domain-containing protein n=1 Tax=Breznakia pachnodae TaxID=265178 RepID=A0ABU0DZ16_9FIRM|nr:Mbeg1-like protein [Breznakia pachnodae]MDQ0359893.1 hypothetical protein [Breznakia pachnodae]
MNIHEVLLILNSLVYSSGINKSNSDISVFEMVDDGLLVKPNDDMIATQEEWDALLKTVKQNETYFSNIKIADIESVKDAQKNVTFVNSSTNEVYIVFKGTGSLEWHDNAMGGLLMTITTPQQQNAVNYTNMIAQVYPDSELFASGHSKGGNKAQVVTILCDDVTAGYSFDGQGMGKGFLIQYQDQIEKNKDKIFSYSNQSDYVNPLFTTIAGNIFFTESDGNLLDWLMDGDYNTLKRQHSPLTMFELKDGVLEMRNTEGVKQDPTAIFLGNVVEYFRENMSEDDFEIFSTMVMHLMETDGCGDPDYSFDDIPEEFWWRLIAHIYNFGIDLGMTEEDIELLLENINIFIPDDSALKYLVGAIQVYKGYKVVSSFMSENKGVKNRLNELLLNYNKAYKSVAAAKKIVRDFSSNAQAVMHDCLINELTNDMLSIGSVSGWDYVANILSNTGVTDAHRMVANDCFEMLRINSITDEKYNKIIADVYEADSNFAKQLKKRTESLQKYRNNFTS